MAWGQTVDGGIYKPMSWNPQESICIVELVLGQGLQIDGSSQRGGQETSRARWRWTRGHGLWEPRLWTGWQSASHCICRYHLPTGLHPFSLIPVDKSNLPPCNKNPHVPSWSLVLCPCGVSLFRVERQGTLSSERYQRPAGSLVHKQACAQPGKSDHSVLLGRAWSYNKNGREIIPEGEKEEALRLWWAKALEEDKIWTQGKPNFLEFRDPIIPEPK